MDEMILEEVVVIPRGDMYLKFADEAEALSVLYEQATHFVTTYDEEGIPTTTEEQLFDGDVPVMKLKWEMSIDVVGIIYKPTGKVLVAEEGDVPEMAPVDGWHVNTRGQMPDELLVYATEPLTPVRVWA